CPPLRLCAPDALGRDLRYVRFAKIKGQQLLTIANSERDFDRVNEWTSMPVVIIRSEYHAFAGHPLTRSKRSGARRLITVAMHNGISRQCQLGWKFWIRRWQFDHHSLADRHHDLPCWIAATQRSHN